MARSFSFGDFVRWQTLATQVSFCVGEVMENCSALAYTRKPLAKVRQNGDQTQARRSDINLEIAEQQIQAANETAKDFDRSEESTPLNPDETG